MQGFDTQPQVQQPLTHSRVGIAAFAVSIVGALFFCAGFGIAFYMGFSTVGADTAIDPAAPQLMLASILMLGSLLINVVALGLGIGSLFQKESNRTFGIIGLVLGALLICFFGSLAMLGLTL